MGSSGSKREISAEENSKVETAQKIGLIAGRGKMPILVAQAAQSQGMKVISIALEEKIKSELESFSHKVYAYNVGQTNKIIKTLRSEEVREVAILGKVDKRILLKPWKLDWRAIRTLKRVMERGDDKLFNLIREELAKDGLELIDQTRFLNELLAKKGTLGLKEPTRKEWEDIRFGFRMAKEVGALDIGQTVVVKDKTILAVEAIEGTDEAIRRGCRMGQEGAIVAKVSRPRQDFRLDVPTVGTKTLQVMREGKAAALALEAEKTLVVDLKEVVKVADEASIAIVAL